MLALRITKALHLESGAARSAPAPPAGSLPAGKGGEPAGEPLGCAPAAGQLSCLQEHLLPSIAMVASHAAQLAGLPRRSRELAVIAAGKDGHGKEEGIARPGCWRAGAAVAAGKGTGMLLAILT